MLQPMSTIPSPYQSSPHDRAEANNLADEQFSASPEPAKESFMEAAQRLTLLARLGIDIDKLDAIESEIEELESLDSLTEEQQSKLDSLYEQRDELFREAMERQNGKSLPPGSMLSFSV